MSEMKKCELHPEENVNAQCSQCGRPICSLCRRQYGYFCSQECKQQVQQATQTLVEPESQKQYDAVQAKMTSVTKFVKGVFFIAVVVAAVLIYLKATSKAGKVLWEFKPSRDKVLSSMVDKDGALYVACDDGKLYVLDKDTGLEKSSFTADASLAQMTPIVAGSNMCIVRDDKNIYGVNTDNSQLVWKKTIDGKFKKDLMHDGNNIYYVLDFYRDLTYEEIRERQQRQNTKAGDSMFSSMFSFGGKREKPKIKTATSIYAVDCLSGAELWTRSIDKKTSLGYVTVKDDNLYLNKSELAEKKWKNVLLALDAQTGKGKWQAEISGGSLSMIHPGGEGLLLVSQRKIYFISSAGEQVWSRDRGEQSFWNPVVVRDKVYYKENRNSLSCLSLDTGKKIWIAELESFMSQPVVGSDGVFVTSVVEKQVKPSSKKDIKLPQYKAPDSETQELFDNFTQGAADGSSVRIVPVLYALDNKTGAVRWMREELGGQVLCQGSKLFVVTSSSRMSILDQTHFEINKICALDTRKGKVLWKYRHEGRVPYITADNEKVYFTSASGTIHFTGGGAETTRENIIYALSIGR